VTLTCQCRHVISWHGSRSRQGQQTATQRSGEAVAVPGSSSTTRLGTSQQPTAIAIATHEPASSCARTPHSNATMHPMRRPSSPSRSVWAAVPRSAPSPRPPCPREHVCGYLTGGTQHVCGYLTGAPPRAVPSEFAMLRTLRELYNIASNAREAPTGNCPAGRARNPDEI
jgi:hypothetical protein